MWFSFIFVFISYFIWRLIAKKTKADSEVSKVNFNQSKKTFITVNALYCIFIFCSWFVFMFYISPWWPSDYYPILLLIVFLVTMPAGMGSIGLLIYLSTKFKWVVQSSNPNPCYTLYYELLWMIFFFPILGIWLMVYINKQLSYPEQASNERIETLIVQNNLDE